MGPRALQLEVAAYFGPSSPALVEKDFQVVKALAAIAALETGPLQLVFGGGTALSLAHRLIRRMSEDIDLKIVADEEPSRPALRRLREAMTNTLLRAGFRFDPGNEAHRTSRNESRYTIYRLAYEPLSRGEGSLRPEIQIEEQSDVPASGGSVAGVIVRGRGFQTTTGSRKHRMCFDHTDGGGEVCRIDPADRRRNS